MTKDEALTLAAEMERGQFSTTLLPAAAELRRLHEENQKLRAQQVLDRKAENARELGLDYEPEQEPKCGAIIEVFGKGWRLEYLSLPVGKHKLYTQQYTYTTPPQRKPPQFPTMLRKMWSGSEVQDWIKENWNKGEA